MPQPYTVLSSTTALRHQIEIKKSRFLTVLQRINHEDDAQDLLADLRREFHDARHQCSAWVVGSDRRIQRSSDDGEPSGTAGIPMLEAITQRRTGGGDSPREEVSDLSDVCAVVVRWFGGTLLGAGGLVRAYSDSVSQALDRAEFAQRARLGVYEVNAPLAQAARWENELRTASVTVMGTDWSANGATLRVATDDTEEAVAKLRAHVAELSSGNAYLTPVGTDWVDLPSSPAE
ncbi:MULTISPECIES: YigZ family protein [Kocuria]|uniref:YigZ family protein n=1 Tax=Kocuria subflava TaxID=1736139 RepID=A0A846TSP2_9MICC|nr:MULTISPECIES: YigZ family protein [Kocuria]NKE08792.1 YigZ family protein [Kocuria subflava]